MLIGDVDSADNEDTDADLRTNDIVAKCRPYVLENEQSFNTNIYLLSSRGISRSKIKPETKL